MSVVLALLGALTYGFADFAGGLASRRAPALAVVFVGQCAGLLLVAVLAAALPARFDSASLGWGAAAGVVGVVALLLFYRSLALGSMSVVAPLTAVLSAVVPVVAGLLLGERPSAVVLVGVLLAAAAVVLVGAEGGRLPTAAQLRGPVVAGALGAGTGFGLLFVLLSRADDDTGFQPLVAARAASLLLLAAVALRSRRSLVPRGAPLLLVLASGLGDMTANALFVLASRLGLLSVTGVLLALYPAGTVLLAVLVLRERLARVQLAGLALALAGVGLIAVG
ncbi:EamA family transporter [Amnibacterium endophyticum]|uniref:EamA family transporter n=1 Tax=Amnibacterium endophyticum TaxID=2109337 RepID=A0ABW4LF33_9MICO